MRNSTMEYKVNQAYEELKRLIQWHPDSEGKFLQKMVCFLLPEQRKYWTEAIRDLRQSLETEHGMIFIENTEKNWNGWMMFRCWNWKER